MRNTLIIGLLCSAAFSGAANAQSEREILKDEKAVAAQQAQLDDAKDRGNSGDIHKASEQLDGARQELKEDRGDQQTSRYQAPYRNWSQSTPAVGSQLRSKFYGIQYVISNPEHYQLGAIASDQRWIRYGDDILLVNVRSGRVEGVSPTHYRDL